MLMTLTYHYHSGFSLKAGDDLLVFDYWEGEHGELKEPYRITKEQISECGHVYVFISHEHPDHLDPVVYTWRDAGHVTYIVSDDMPIGQRGRRLGAGDSLTLTDQLSVKAFESTDLGVSFLVSVHGLKLFHAGDLNFWHWSEESTTREIEESEALFHQAMKPLEQEKIDVAMFPVDPRQGRMFDAGANYFMMTVKPGLFIPMHYWGRTDMITDFARRSRNRQTEVIPMIRQGDRLELDVGEDGAVSALYDPAPVENIRRRPAEPDEPAAEADGEAAGEDPFEDTDLPVDFAGSGEEQEE